MPITWRRKTSPKTVGLRSYQPEIQGSDGAKKCSPEPRAGGRSPAPGGRKPSRGRKSWIRSVGAPRLGAARFRGAHLNLEKDQKTKEKLHQLANTSRRPPRENNRKRKDTFFRVFGSLARSSFRQRQLGTGGRTSVNCEHLRPWGPFNYSIVE